eukprot:9259587-Alexandrium_andersonii.AAC.1
MARAGTAQRRTARAKGRVPLRTCCCAGGGAGARDARGATLRGQRSSKWHKLCQTRECRLSRPAHCARTRSH